MSTLALAASICTRRSLPRPALAASCIGQTGAGGWTRWFRWRADRRHLLEMDDRLLCDVGLTIEDVRRGQPFRVEPGRPASLVRLGTFDGRAWRLKLYVATSDAPGLRSEDLAAARRAFHAVLAAPGCEPVAGFAVLSATHDSDLPLGSLVLTVCHWDGPTLRRCALLLPVGGGPVCRLPDHGFSQGELRLGAREGRAWHRYAERPSPATLTAYIAEDCA